MGTLAKFGILQGKKALLNSSCSFDVEPKPIPQKLSEFSRKCLGRFGFARIAEKVLNRHELTVAEVELLISKAPMAVLMKLVQLVPSAIEEIAPQPLVMLPFNQLIHKFEDARVIEISSNILKRIKAKEIRVVIDRIDPLILERGGDSIIKSISTCRRGITLVGPSVDEILELVRWPQGSGSCENGMRFEGLLEKLRLAGMARLKPTCAIEALRLVHQCGLPCSLITNLDEFLDAGKLAHELHRINQVSVEGLIDVWVPGLRSLESIKDAKACTVLDFRLLRALAVGTIYLRNIPYRRASSTFFSLAALQYARFCGANDFGFGAVDARTKQQLHLQPLGRLEKVLGGGL